MAVEIHEDQPLVEAVAYVPEGTFGTYNHVWNRDYGAGVNVDAVPVNNIGTVYAEDSGWDNVYVRTLGGVEDNRANYSFGWNFHPISDAGSVTGRYRVAFDVAAVLLEVWRDGAVIWSRDFTLDNPAVFWPELFEISPNGEFVSVGAIDSITFETQWVMLYRGA